MDRTVVENAEGFQAGNLRFSATTPWEFCSRFFWPKDYVTVEDMTSRFRAPIHARSTRASSWASFEQDNVESPGHRVRRRGIGKPDRDLPEPPNHGGGKR